MAACCWLELQRAVGRVYAESSRALSQVAVNRAYDVQLTPPPLGPRPRLSQAGRPRPIDYRARDGSGLVLSDPLSLSPPPSRRPKYTDAAKPPPRRPRRIIARPWRRSRSSHPSARTSRSSWTRASTARRARGAARRSEAGWEARARPAAPPTIPSSFPLAPMHISIGGGTCTRSQS